MIKIFNILFILLIQTFISSCTDTNDVVNPGEKPIVEAYLAPGHSVSLKVFTEIPYAETSEGVSEPIDGLTIKITGSNGKIFSLKSIGSGLYTSDSNEIIEGAPSKYKMEFEYKGRIVSAETEIPEKPAGFNISTHQIYRTQVDLSNGGFPGGPGGGFGGIDNTPVELSWSNPENVYHFIAVENTEKEPQQIIIPPTGSEFPAFRFRFTNEPLLGTHNNIQPQSLEYFGNYDVILYRINPDYSALYQSSGTTTQNLSTPPSSITNGLGIFTGINADTLKLNVGKN
ncbi:DUF4249 family protein [Emticicia sp. BO119]|uniref:DUF4249 family protein n=1 Tax=Emticicia sp. BO119 TaxID=2757768 RepID=UPI0015F057B4|nr:DUF4249 family protein [Emticicia sp. BO119]MBA4853290.1 DUF4249 family protein [Emticicia sp. BO119]